MNDDYGNYNLELYYFPACPYCLKVLDYFDKKGIKITLKNVRKDEAAARKLREIGGKYQVPCLFIDGDPLYESDDIIKWFEERL